MNTDKLTRMTSDLGRKATELSNRLEAVESHLCSMPGKVSASVTGNGVTLQFDRDDKGWGLYLIRDGEDHHVTSSSVEIKALAAGLLPELVKRINATMKERIKRIDAGLDAMASVGFDATGVFQPRGRG